MIISINQTCSVGGRNNMPLCLQVDFWPWKWCPSHMWCGLLLYQF